MATEQLDKEFMRNFVNTWSLCFRAVETLVQMSPSKLGQAGQSGDRAVRFFVTNECLWIWRTSCIGWFNHVRWRGEEDLVWTMLGFQVKSGPHWHGSRNRGRMWPCVCDRWARKAAIRRPTFLLAWSGVHLCKGN